MSRVPTASPPVSTWADYLAWRRILWAVVLLGPLVSVAGWVLLTGSERLLLPLAAWGVAVLLVALRLQHFNCPRCQHHFFHQWPPLLGLMARRCVSCMLPKE